jgi:hypothetical protein
MERDSQREVRGSKKLLVTGVAAVCLANGVVYEGLVDAQTGNNCVHISDPLSWGAVPLSEALQATGVIESPAAGNACPSD